MGFGKESARARIKTLSRDFGLAVHPDARVATLSEGERRRVEIVKALYRDARVLILDEPTAVLTPQETDALFAALKKTVAQGLAVIFISHKLHEIMEIADRVVVLRHGKLARGSGYRRYRSPHRCPHDGRRRGAAPRDRGGDAGSGAVAPVGRAHARSRGRRSPTGRRAQSHAESLIETYDVRCQGPDMAIRLLSGGNMQNSSSVACWGPMGPFNKGER